MIVPGSGCERRIDAEVALVSGVRIEEQRMTSEAHIQRRIASLDVLLHVTPNALLVNEVIVFAALIG